MMARVLAVLAVCFFLVVLFRKSWTTTQSDFPNYHTAAILTVRGEALRNYYDWTWFQRQMNFAAYERQLGTYVPQTPVAMLPFVPLTGLAPQRAKQAWLLCNLAFLGLSVWLLARMTGFRVEQLALAAFAGFGSLYSNFFYGQYYVFLLLLLTLSFYFLDRKKFGASGVLAGLAFALKLYGGPLLLYFAVRRHWRAVAGFALALACGVGVAIAVFGWGDVHYYAAQILPRAVEGEVIDPYNSGNGTMATLLRRLFVLEPELNPDPMWNAPVTFFFLRPFLSLLILGATLLGLAGNRDGIQRRNFAWFLIATLLLSANTASYTFILLLLPVSLLLVDAGLKERIFLIAAFFAACFPLRAGWVWAFPKLWVLLAMYFVVGRHYFRSLSPRLATVLVLSAAALAAVNARQHIVSFAAEPGQRWERLAPEKNALFSSSPAVTQAGIFYQSIGDDRYILRWLHDGKIEKLVFEGHAFQPVAPVPDGPIYFELVARGTSTTMAFDPRSWQAAPAALPGSAVTGESIASPDGKWIAFQSTQSGPRRIWVRNVVSGGEQLLTGGNCNSWAPVWELDSSAVIFASDCGRGIGLPSLYRARVARP
jgi:hypothetical protein